MPPSSCNPQSLDPAARPKLVERSPVPLLVPVVAPAPAKQSYLLGVFILASERSCAIVA